MKTRRAFLKLTASGALAATAARAQDLPASSASLTSSPGSATWSSATPPPTPTTGIQDRATWVRLAQKLASPLLPTLAARRLKATIPIEPLPLQRGLPPARPARERPVLERTAHQNLVGKIWSGENLTVDHALKSPKYARHSDHTPRRSTRSPRPTDAATA